jgi:hypothetical protein
MSEPEVLLIGEESDAETTSDDADFKMANARLVASPLPMTFMDEACSMEFTFSAAVFHQNDSPMDDGSLKRPLEHDSEQRNGTVTPQPSPKKMRVWMDLGSTPHSMDKPPGSPSPPPLSVLDEVDVFPNPVVQAMSFGASDDMSESACLGNDKSDASGKTADYAKKVDLRDYWKVETAEEKAQRHHWEWERLERGREAREFDDEQSQMRQRDKVRADNRKRAERCRAIKQKKRIEAGWVPGKKRVSVTDSIPTLDKILTSCCI